MTGRLARWVRRALRPAPLITAATAAIVLGVGLPFLRGKPPTGDYEVRMKRYLGRKPTRDGTRDYRDALQEAIDESVGKTLILPDYPLLVATPPGARAALVIRHPITIRGSRSSVLIAATPGTQLLRVEDTADVHLEGFTLQGVGGDGAGMAHGLLQVTGAWNLVAQDLEVRDADADGMAFAGVDGIRVTGCRVEGASKSGIYLVDCERAIVSGNTVLDFGGHLEPGGAVIGAGIQLSSNHDLVCSDNLITDGIGSGILCNAYGGGRKPYGNVLQGNRIARTANPSNPAASCGIRCTNGAPDKATNTVVALNSIRGCGAYGLYVENHDASTVLGNTILESERSGIVISTVSGLTLTDNVILNSDVSATGEEAGIFLINGASGVRARGNSIRNSARYAQAFAREGLRNTSSAADNDLEPQIEHGAGPPVEGQWFRGDRIYSTHPAPGEPVGWICTSQGTPGIWAPFGAIE